MAWWRSMRPNSTLSVAWDVKSQALQARARDMEVFVQVLLSYSEDPRDVSEIRASEARYRALADSLRSKLDGQEHQARLHALKQREVGIRGWRAVCLRQALLRHILLLASQNVHIALCLPLNIKYLASRQGQVALGALGVWA